MTPTDTSELDQALQALWALGKDPDPDAVQRALARVAASLEGSASLQIQTAREMAMRALKGKISAPAKFVDAALNGVTVAPHTDSAGDDGEGESSPYRITEAGLIYIKSTSEGLVPVPLTNFTARIVGEVRRDDGVETERSFEIAAHHRGREHRFEVGSAEFPTMRWVTEQLGATAIVNAGRGTRDHARAAIQHLSDDVETRTVFTHLGWRKIDDRWCYLHADGGIGQVGQLPAMGVDLPGQLTPFTLPQPPDSEDLRTAVEASLRTLELLPEEITLPLLCAVFRAPLGATDFSLHVAGQTGEGKSELAALAQQHFGAGLDARHLPGSWSSTGNSLEVLAFAAKDALLVVDDFAPDGTRYDVQRLHREAARLLRAQGNRSGRGRLRPDGTLRPVKAPRGLVLSTGEDIPRNHSIRARMLVLEIPKGELDWELLTACQQDAAAGLYARAMAAYLRWLAEHYEAFQQSKPGRIAELRSQAATSAVHRRTPSIVAELALGLEQFLAFARASEALSREETEALWSRGWDALGRAVEEQAGHLGAQDQVSRFLELLRSAIASGRAHVASGDGNRPKSPEVWGWRRRGESAGKARDEWQAHGERVGWLRDDDLYLEPDAAYKAAEGMAMDDGLSITPRTLWKRMSERGLLASQDSTRKTLRIRVTLAGARRTVLHLKGSTLLSRELAQPDQAPPKPRVSGVCGWAGSDDPAREPDQRTCPGGSTESAPSDAPGQVGQVGQLPRAGEVETDEWGEI